MDSNPFDISKETKDNLNSNNRYMDSKQQIQMLAQEIAKEIVDKETMEKYGYYTHKLHERTAASSKSGL